MKRYPFISYNARYIENTSDQRRACTTWSLLKAIVDHSGKKSESY